MPFRVFRSVPRTAETNPAEIEQLVSRFSGIPTYRQSLAALQLELRRARRYEKPLTVLALGLTPGVASGATALTGFLYLGVLLRETLRETDLLACAAEHQLYAALLTETGKKEAQEATLRIGALVQERVHVKLRAGIAEYPVNGLSIDDLFASARNAWGNQLQVGAVPVVKEAFRV